MALQPMVNRACLSERINKHRRQPLAFPVVNEGRLRTSPFMPFTTLVPADASVTSSGGYWINRPDDAPVEPRKPPLIKTARWAAKEWQLAESQRR
jgi:hypothetical protein